MYDVNIAVDVDFHEDGTCSGRVFAGQRIATITPNGAGHDVVYENFEHINVPKLELPMDGPGTVGFVIGNIFGDINPVWATEQLQKMLATSFGSDLETIGSC